MEEMSMENSWVPVTPMKPPLPKSCNGEENQQKSDGSDFGFGGKVVACSDSLNFVTLSSEKSLVVDLNEKNWDENEPNCSSISVSSQNAESASTKLVINSHCAGSSKTIPPFTPVTPDKRKNVEREQVVQVQSFPAEDKMYVEGQKQQCKTVDIRTDGNCLQQEVCELVLDSLSAAALTPFKDNHNSDKESIIVEVNETPKLKKRRRKHRPKVITGGKPTPKPATPKAVDAKSKGNSTVKRKYVRKNAVNKLQETPLEQGTPTPATPIVAGSEVNSKFKRKYVRKNVVNRTIETPQVEKLGVSKECCDMDVPEYVKKTCRRGLKFHIEVQQEDESSSCKYSSEISESQAQVLTPGEVQSHSIRRILKDNEYLPESLVSNLGIPIEYRSSQLKLQTNFYMEEEIRGKINSKNDTQLLSSSKDSICSTATISTGKKQARGSKRDFCQYIKGDNIGGSDTDQYPMPPSEHLPCIHERAKTVKMQHSATSSIHFNVTEQPYQVNNSKENPCTTNATYYPSTPRVPGESVDLHNKLQPFELTVASNQVGTTPRRWKDRARAHAQAQTMGSCSHTAQSNIQATDSLKQPPVVTNLQRVENSHGPCPSLITQVDLMQLMMARKEHTGKSLSLVSDNTDGAQQHRKPAVYSRCRKFQRSPEAPSVVNSEQKLSTDFIVEKMKVLDINREGKISLYEEQSAMIPYNMQNKGGNALIVYKGDGSVVPYEGFLRVKKRRQHAKVDLDGETIRVWKLLMGNSCSEGIDGSDEDRAKQWEEERRVFGGRADSFIARMHLIQGDRRFVHWKGSVLDSVIGVFLTQNVSDHLSSSAFMSLASRFPLKSRSLHKSCFDDGTSLVVDEPEINVGNAENRVNWNERSSAEPICKQSCMTVYEAEKAKVKVLTSSESSGSNVEGFSSTREWQLLTSYSSQKIGEWESQRSTKEINTTIEEAFSLGDGKVVDTAISSQVSIFLQHSFNSSFSSSIEDRRPCLKRKYERDMSNLSKDMSVHVSASSVKIAETTMLKTDCKNGSCNDSSDDKSEDACSKPGEKDGNLQENNSNADCPESFLRESPSHSSDNKFQKTLTSGVTEVKSFGMCREDTAFFYASNRRDGHHTNVQAGALGSAAQTTVHNKLTTCVQATRHSSESCNINQGDQDEIFRSPGREIENPQSVESQASVSNHKMHQVQLTHSVDNLDVMEKNEKSDPNKHDHSLSKNFNDTKDDTPNPKRKRVVNEKKDDINWDNLRKQAQAHGRRERTANTMDSLDWEAVRCADVDAIAYTIRERGMNNRLAERIKAFLNRLVEDHGSIDLEWLRDVSPDQAKEYLLSVRGLGLKSVECVRLLTLHQLAFPVDTNVGRIAVRLGWVPLRPLPESLQLHLLELYPVLESIQKYLWPRLCKLDQRTLYELHYQMITFGKVFCTKNKPNCNACPMRGECRHFASAFASARLALPAPEEKSLVNATENKSCINPAVAVDQQLLTLPQLSNSTEKSQQSIHQFDMKFGVQNIEPIIEEPATPEPECPQISENDIEDTLCEGPDGIPLIKLNVEAFTMNLQNYMQENMELQEGSISKALVVLSPEAACIPVPKLKNISRLRTEHQVYELPDTHPLLEKLQLEQREQDDPCFYLLAIWTPGETANSIDLPQTRCSSSQENGEMCGENECFSCNSVREANSQMVRGTILIPCRTAMRGSFPLNGTYFQVNEVFADHDSSLNPIDVPRAWLWNLSRRTVYFGTSIPTIFKGLSTEEIQHCFWRGYVCVRGFDRKIQAPRPLMARLHFPASKLTATRGKTGKPEDK